MTIRNNNDDGDGFFVGYREMPTRLRRFYLPLTILMLGLSALAGFGIASLQKDSGHASWDTSNKETMEGLLLVDPYPVLHRPHPEKAGEIESVMLVQQGKYSANEVALAHHGTIVAVSGFPIRRGGWTMLELTSAADIAGSEGIDPEARSQLRQRSETKSLGQTTLIGEVADSKCFLGVMKPGAGTVHKACAEVCMIGGIPAMLVVRGADNRKYGYLLTDSSGASVSEEIADTAAEKIQVSGQLEQRGDLLYLIMSDG